MDTDVTTTRRAEVDIEAIRHQVDSVLNEKLYWFPVRHHSPATALFLEKALRKRKPRIVFIEGPAEANHLIPFIVDKQTKPPIAIYSSYRDDDNVLGLAGILSPAENIPARFSAWYPLLPYSPEYIAMQIAQEIKAEVVFIDLPNHAEIETLKLVPSLLGINPRSKEPGAMPGAVPGTSPGAVPGATPGAVPGATPGMVPGATPGAVPGTSPGAVPGATPGMVPGATPGMVPGATPGAVLGATPGMVPGATPGAAPGSPVVPAADGPTETTTGGESRQREDDKLIVESDFYKGLAEVAGYRSWNETWDSLFEQREFTDVESFRAEIAHFCAAARATTSDAQIKSDGTLQRERHMWQTINRVLLEKQIKPEEAFIVCGGFHLFLDREDKTPPPESPAGTLYTTLVPYSYFRVSELSGYGAGNRAPQFYQTMYELVKAGKPEEVLVRHVVTVLDKARRKKDLPVSAADAIAICQHAEMLARLRGRLLPVLDDIHDAIMTCCCKGNPLEDGVQLQEALDASDIGSKIGKVSPGLGQLPILSAFYNQMSELDLGEVLGKEKRLKFELDKREELATRRSTFFHRLKFLKVPLVSLLEAPTDLTTGRLFREKWLLSWDPQVESSLIELSLYGDTVESAALSRLREVLAVDEFHAGRICRRLVEAIDMNLPELIYDVEEACTKAIDNDSRFASLSLALSNLLILDRYAVYRNLRRSLLKDLIGRCYDRACFAIMDVVAAPEEQQEEVVSSLLNLADLTQRGDRPDLDRQLFVQHLNHAAAATEVPFLKGAFLGLLAELREISPEELAAELANLAKSSVETMLTAGDLLDGIMAVSRTSIMLGADSLIAAINVLLHAADMDSFLNMLPKMRGAFERLHERQRDSFAARVAQSYGLEEKESLRELRTSVGAASVFARIDQQVAQIMKDWEL